tara:strand:+ start:447 stop:752 length:306 start_codon:yes stop_codon:yes gene_type:complete
MIKLIDLINKKYLKENPDMEFKPKSMFYVPSKKKSLKKKFKDGKGTELLQDVDLDIKVGDTVLMGKFKNKQVIVKNISYNEKGDLMINGKPALKFRLLKRD